MRHSARLLALCLVWLCLADSGLLLPPRPAAAQAPTEPARVLGRLPHDAAAFSQGLALARGVLFESTGLYGASTLRRVDPATGRVLARRALPRRFFGEGLALCPEGNGARLVQLTWRERRILTYDPETLLPLESLPLRGEGWGLACHGGEAVLSDGTHLLRFLDARTLAETGRTLAVRDGADLVERLNELEWVNGWLVANIWQEDVLAVIRPDDGQVALWLDLTALRRSLDPGAEAANGVAFNPKGDGGRGALLLTGKRWNAVFIAALPELMRRPPSFPRTGR